MRLTTRISLCALILLLVACSGEEKKFRRVPSSHSGITFTNRLKESVDFNIFNYMYFYNGGGVAVGDLNGDGLPDIYFTANQADNKLYLNRGDLKFEDVTSDAGVEGINGWTTGVTMADVNGDGRLDIYVSNLGKYLIYNGRNQLFINEGNDEQGIPRFVDRAIEYGLDLSAYSTQAAFFDYDRDGDLDMFMLTHSLHQEGTFVKATIRAVPHPQAGDKLLRNDNGHFTDVTAEAGIYGSVLGYGLGVAISDINMDGWPDIYVGNDFHENDYLYINNGDGTFRESLEQSMNHTSRYTMGVDCGDFNNDGFPDVIAMDMLPEDPEILKASVAEDAFDVYNFKLGFGYAHQFARNTLQVNNQDGTFSEIALQSGVAATDWSWSTLFADFDLDGRKDILVTNGIVRRPNDLDYINFIQVDSVQIKLDKMTTEALTFVDKMPTVRLPNYLFRNNGDSTFNNVAYDWGLSEASYSNGAAYVDLDNDGDLDIVMNNLESEAFIYENRTINKEKGNAGFLQFVFEGADANKFGVGAKVFLYDSGNLQMQECIPTRGFQSSVDFTLTFGAGQTTNVDSVIVVWPDGRFQMLKNVKTNQRLVLKQSDAQGTFNYERLYYRKPHLLEPVSEPAIPFVHKENKFVEFNREQLLPHMLSAEGPAVAVGDINGDGLEDIFIGGGKWQTGSVFVQNSNQKFVLLDQPVLKADSTYEDVDAVFFDADGDSDLDLFVVSGGNEFSGKSKYRLPRLYLNDGKGSLTKSEDLPEIFLNGSCVAVFDFDGDGDEDIFLGARSIPWRYGIRPDSYLLRNEGAGRFVDVTEQVAPALKAFGFVKDALWVDMDGDQTKDLVIAAEWQPVAIFLNKGGKLDPMDLGGSGLENTSGWWNVLTAADFDGDGDMDLIAGNLGTNSKLKATAKQPVCMYVSDFDKNDSTDQILTHFVNGKEYPFHTRDEMTKQMPFLKKKYLSYRKFATTSLADMFGAKALNEADKYVAQTFHTSLIENLGNGKFLVKPLPQSVQISTTNALLVDDFNGDGQQDVLVGGNFYHANIQMGRYDASYGLLLLGDGKGSFHVVPPYISGFSVKGEVRNLQPIKVGDQTFYLAIRNNDSPVAFRRPL